MTLQDAFYCLLFWNSGIPKNEQVSINTFTTLHDKYFDTLKKFLCKQVRLKKISFFLKRDPTRKMFDLIGFMLPTLFITDYLSLRIKIGCIKSIYALCHHVNVQYELRQLYDK